MEGGIYHHHLQHLKFKCSWALDLQAAGFHSFNIMEVKSGVEAGKRLFYSTSSSGCIALIH